MKKLKAGSSAKGIMAGAIGEAAGAAVSEREYERLRAAQEGASAKEDVLKKLNKNSKRLPGDRAIPVPFPDLEMKPEKKTQPETNAEKKAKRLEELRKEIEGKSKGGFIIGKGADYIKDLL
jgi:hypothetical protein